MSGSELPKVIDKSEADIDAAISSIQSCDLPTSTKEFAISCIKLAVWLPKALPEHKIRLSNLRKLIFGRGKKNRAKTDKGNVKSPSENLEPELSNDTTDAAAIEPIKTIRLPPLVVRACQDMVDYHILPTPIRLSTH